MRLYTPEISWHQKEPIFSVDFCPNTRKLASSGADFTIKIWLIKEQNDGDRSIGVEFLANLDRHVKPVNVVRFSPNGLLLASAGDDGAIILWKLNANEKPSLSFGKEEVEDKELWNVHKMLRGHVEDIYDLAWSPDSSQLITGSVDNSAIIWDAIKGQSLKILTDHKHYVQGVCWDPQGYYLATHSSDRTCRIYTAANPKCIYSISKNNTSYLKDGQLVKCKYSRMFMDETMQSFFRRCSYSIDGSFLFLPAGLYDGDEKPRKTTYVFARGCYSKPIRHLPGPKKATLAVKCSPVVYELIREKENINPASEKDEFLRLPYRMVFAVASLDSVTLYDTQHDYPIGYCANMHYASLTDLAWSSDGKLLVVSSLDGYCSFIKFEEEELGIPIKYDPIEYQMNQAKIRKANQEKKEKQADGVRIDKKIPEVFDKKDLKEKIKIDRSQTTIDKLFITPIKKRKRINISDEKSKESPANTTEEDIILVDDVVTALPEKCLSENGLFESEKFEPSSLNNALAEISTASTTLETNSIMNKPDTCNDSKQIRVASSRTEIIPLQTTRINSKPPKRVNVTTLQTFTPTEPEQSPKKNQAVLLLSPALSPKRPKRVKVTTICTFNAPNPAENIPKNDNLDSSLNMITCNSGTTKIFDCSKNSSLNTCSTVTDEKLVTNAEQYSQDFKINNGFTEQAEKQMTEKTIMADTESTKEYDVIVLD